MTALTPAQVRDHARALILRRATESCCTSVFEYVRSHGGESCVSLTADEVDALHAAITSAIRTARITVDWDEEGST